ncbi:hypothetical protein CC86DRAFT_417508 [Ophiobolus disseminans]|uniref:F-box domain-containing protein n=1 Tax=Ophiobolus disseminans TaxID=1469910 RepID=A0A6A6ZZB2_9PLEO|nr:hypothetical protein CC86DRAFT_417508 [Ophiobolus disseminans]
MATLLSLPDELQLNVAQRLDSAGRYNLTLTCRTTRDAAQEALYAGLKLACPYGISREWSPTNKWDTFLLARTLLERPALAGKVKALFLVAEYNISSAQERDDWEVTYNTALTVIRGLNRIYAEMASSWEARAEQWCQALKGNTDVAWAGVILAVTPNLKDLALEILTEHGLRTEILYLDTNRYLSNPIEAFVGADPRFDLRLIPGLRSVTGCEYIGRDLDWSSCTLPRVKSLIISPEPYMEDVEDIRATDPGFFRECKVEAVRMDCKTYAFWSQGLYNPTPMLQSSVFTNTNFPFLKALFLCFHNLDLDQDRARNDYQRGVVRMVDNFPDSACDFMLSRIAGLASTLESLEVYVDDNNDMDWVEHVDNLSTLCQFSNLKRLAMPQDFLIGRNYGVGLPSQCWILGSITRVLPSSLEEITVTLPTLQIRGWIQDLLYHQISFPQLRKFNIPCIAARGVSFPDLWYDDDDVWDRLKASDIDCWVTYPPEEKKDDWWTIDKAKNVEKVVDWIEELDRVVIPEDWVGEFFKFVDIE